MGTANKRQENNKFDLPFTYSIRRSQRATKTRIVVSTGHKVEVVAPPQVPEQKLHQFVSEKQHWIVSAMHKLACRQLPSPTPTIYHDGSSIKYLGVNYPLTIVPTTLKRAKISFVNGFIASIPESLAPTEHNDAIKTSLTCWMKHQARVKVEQLVTQHAKTRNLIPHSINIKTQKSRWGSCGIHNDININWLLVLAPPEVLEYVVVHELCHIRVRNHSPRFWQLVSEHLPDYQEPQLWLKQNGSQLMRGL
jgi:hypothetical protein